MCENRELVSPHSHYPWNSQIHSQRGQSFVDAAGPTVLKALGIKVQLLLFTISSNSAFILRILNSVFKL